MARKRRPPRVLTPLFRHLWEQRITLEQAATLSGLKKLRLHRLATGVHQPTVAERAALTQAFPELPWGDDPYRDLPQMERFRQVLSSWLLSDEGLLVARRLAQLLAPSP
mgnify:CR=1 FL=1